MRFTYIFLAAIMIFSFSISFAQPPKEILEQKADSLYNEGKALFENYEYEAAISKFKQAFDLNTKLGRLEKVALGLKDIGETLYELSQFDSALIWLDSALVKARQAEDRQLQGRIQYLISTVYHYMGQSDKTLAYGDSALVIARSTEDRQGEARALSIIGLIYTGHPIYNDQALAYCDSALAIARQINDKKIEIQTLRYIINIYGTKGQKEQAMSYLDSALALAQGEKFKKEKGKILFQKGFEYIYLGHYEKALIHLDSSLAIMKKTNDVYWQERNILRLGEVCLVLGQYEKTLRYMDSLLIMARALIHETNEIMGLLGKALVYRNLSYCAKSIVYFDSALVRARKTDSRYDDESIYLNMSFSYCSLGDYNTAMACGDSGLTIAREIKHAWGEYWGLSIRAHNYIHLQQYEKALAYSDSALIITKGSKDAEAEKYVLDMKGTILSELGQYEKALAYYDTVVVISRSIGVPYFETHRNIGCLYYILKQYDKALAYLDSALTEETKIRERYEIATHYCFGRVYEDMGDLEKATSHYKKSIDVIEIIRKELMRQDLKMTYIESTQDVYQHLINLLIMLERYEEAFDYLERCRSQELRKIFGKEALTAFDPSLRRNLERINFTQAEMAATEKRFSEKQLAKEEFEQKMDELEGKLNQQLFDLKTYHPQLYNVMMPQVKDLKAIQQHIPRNTVFLEFVSSEDRYVVFIFARDKFTVKSYDKSKAGIDSLIDKTLTDLRWLKEKGVIDEHFEDLYKILIRPIESDITDYSHVVLIPYSELHYVPFHALRKQNEKGVSEYLAQWKKISYLPSALFITDLLESKTRARKDLLAFANADGSLPSAEIEVDSISQIFKKSYVYKQDSATKARLIEECNEYRLLHLATHGVLNPDPRFSYIVLAPPEEGHLTVREILGLSGQFKETSLVTLSACETAVEEDPEDAGMELTTLSNAFKVAGVPTIVATLWEIGDRSTAILMKEFYQNLKNKKMTKLEALRAAQLSMIDHPEYNHPYYWAPFILIGDWR